MSNDRGRAQHPSMGVRLRAVPDPAAKTTPSPTDDAAHAAVQRALHHGEKAAVKKAPAQEKVERDAYELPIAKRPQHIIDNSEALLAILDQIEDPKERQAALQSIYFDADGVPHARSQRLRVTPEVPPA